MSALLYAGPFVPATGQDYCERSGGDWAARLSLDGVSGEEMAAPTEEDLRALVVARLRAWLPDARVDAMGDLLEALGQARGARVTATRRASCEAALALVESGAWKES
jgi:hypothetical protein